MDRPRTIAVIGSGECEPQVYAAAERLGRLLAEAGFDLVCGGISGVMEAASRGARQAGGRTIGILPGLDKSAANAFVDLALVTGLSHMRNFLVVANADAVVAVEGEYGTLSEIALARKLGKTVVAIGRWSGIPGVVPAGGPEEAATLARTFARI